MKKGLTTLLVILLAVGAMLVSCKAEVGTPADELVSASFELGSSRALSATLDSWTPEEYYWKYAAKKNVADTSGLTSGTTTAYTETGAEWVKVASGAPVAGLSGHIVPNFSQGLWDFTLFAYKLVGSEYKLVYQGEATAVTLVKGGMNMVNVVVSPIPTGTGTLYIGTTTLTPHTSGDVPSVSRFLKVEDLDGHEYAPTSGTTYELATGAYKVTVTYKTSGITYAEGSVIATVYPNMTTTVTGSVDELVTYAQFEATQNPDIIARTAEVTGITANQLVPTGEYTLQDTSATTTEPAVVTATIPEAAAKALIGSTDPSATMSLALNVDTVDSTSTSVTYEIGMTKTVTLNSQSTTSDVTDVSEFVSVEIALRSGLTGVAVVHGTTGMTPSATKAAYEASTVETFFYDSDAGKLYIKTKSFSPFAVTFDAETAGVAEVNGVKYATLKAAVEAAPAGATVKLLCNTDGAGMTINKNLTIDLNGKTYTGTKDPAGSSGTKNQLFQLLVGNTITIKNGALTTTSGSGMTFLVQNYSNLTLTDVVLDGSNIGDGKYALSNNCGTVVLNGATSIIASNNGKAFDSCKFGSYAIPEVTVNTTGTIKGIIELSGGKLEILSGNFEGSVATATGYTEGDAAFKGGIYNYDPSAYVPAGYKVEEIEEGRYKVLVDAEIEVVTGTTEPVYMSFLDFAASVNDGYDYSNATITLIKDVDLANVANFTPIGTSEDPFIGIFDGGNKTISNLTISNDDENSVIALFAYVGADSVIENLKLADVNITGNGEVAGFVGEADGDNITLSNLSCLSGTINGWGAGIAFYMGGSDIALIDCSNAATIKSTDASCAGIVYWVDGGSDTAHPAIVSGCENTGSVTARGRAGGISGYFNNCRVTGCSNSATIRNGGSMPVAGIVAVLNKNILIQYCINSGNVYSSYGQTNPNASASGIVGHVPSTSSNSIVEFCINTGNIATNLNYACGIVTPMYGGGVTTRQNYSCGNVSVANSFATDGAFGISGASNGGTAKAAASYCLVAGSVDIPAGDGKKSMTTQTPTYCFYYEGNTLKDASGNTVSADATLAILNDGLETEFWGIHNGKIMPVELIPEPNTIEIM